jgi:DUF1680 family protein
MALVELYRATGERRYLDLAAAFIDRRGRGLLGGGRFGRAYWQDHEPVGEAASVAGHAVRQMYLDCGAVDVAVETGDQALLDAVHRRWRDMVETKMYLTGALGSRHRDEAFGDAYELPPDLAYAETCAAIGSAMLAWRLLLATGDPACADVLERTLYNGVLSGLSLDGTAFFYVNPLQRRTKRAWAEPGGGQRAPWYACACCPPNLMRTIAALPHTVATADAGGVQVHQFVTGQIRAAVAGGHATIAVATDYPWDGRVQATVLDTPAEPWTLGLRIPGWSSGATLRAPDGGPVLAPGPLAAETRIWRPGDTLVLDLEMPARVTRPHPRVDAVRGTVALERGPLVYCLETADIGPGTELEDVAIDADVEPRPARRSDVGDVVGLALPARAGASSIDVEAIPYYAWGNRSADGMRVWIPTTSP